MKASTHKRAPKADLAPAPLSVDRLPPHSIEAEQGVLGCILWAPPTCLGTCAEQLKGPEAATVFYDLRHQTLYEVMVAMHEARTPIDFLTLNQRLKDLNQLESIGGLTYLTSLQDAVPSPANLSYYLEIIREKYLLRRMIQACTRAIGRVYEEGDGITTEGVEQLLDEVESDVMAINEERAEGSKILTIRALVQNAIARIEEMHANQGKVQGIATGFRDLDRMTTGLHGGEMIIVAARPSVGKTSFAMNIAEHVALDLKQPVGVFSLEMTADSLILRMLCSRARVNLRNVRDGFLVERDFPKLTAAAGKLTNSPLFIDDTPGLSILQLRAKARRMKQQYDVQLFVIDYLQLLHSTSRKSADNRQQEIAEISSGIKNLAKELNVPVIVLCQLNRDVEKRGANAEPRLSDLRESGSLEQDADLVTLLYREQVDEEDNQSAADAIPVKLLVAKQRNGPTGPIDLTFLKPFTRFESRSKISDEDCP